MSNIVKTTTYTIKDIQLQVVTDPLSGRVKVFLRGTELFNIPHNYADDLAEMLQSAHFDVQDYIDQQEDN